ncbi:MAG: single-stranded DNA-binding protein, partial [Oscillospiraceae bacterium]
TAKEKTTDWIDCVAWRGTAEFICRYFQKGSPIIVEGSLQTRSWEDKEGKKRKSVEVLIENAEFVPGNKTDKSQEAPQEEKFVEVEDEDLPFN